MIFISLFSWNKINRNPAHLEATRLLALFYAELGELASKFATAIDKHDYDYLVELMNLDLFEKRKI